MDCPILLSQKRLCDPREHRDDGRSPFQKDIDRIVFSSAFRRLQDKTQVHPLSKSDYVRTRLTHSIEVASVGRSLGTIVGSRIDEQRKHDFGYIVQAACLAHDLGNPPFGHSGEEAIRSWFQKVDNEQIFGSISDAQRKDFKEFEGNAQGFRILTQLENHRWDGGLQLTHAVLGAYTKYPRSTEHNPINGDVGGKKIGFFREEKKYFNKIANDLNLKSNNQGYWYRYPLAFLTEAADDICYSIIDVEDGFKLGYIKFNDAKDVLTKLANSNVKNSNKKQDNDYIAHLRALAIGNLIGKISDVFIADKERILCGGREKSLISDIDLSLELEETKKLSRKYIFESIEVNGVELAGYAVINGLLSMFAPAILSWQEKNIPVAQLKSQDKKLLLLLGDKLDGVESQYSGLLRLTDYISGMTDTFCIDLYRRLKGIAL